MNGIMQIEQLTISVMQSWMLFFNTFQSENLYLCLLLGERKSSKGSTDALFQIDSLSMSR